MLTCSSESEASLQERGHCISKKLPPAPLPKIAGTRLAMVAMVASLVDTALLARFDEGNGFLRFHHFRRDEDRSCHETSAVLHAFILELDIDPVALLRNVEDLV